MNKACFLVLMALMVSFLAPAVTFAGSSQTPAPAPAPEVGQDDDAGQADQIPGQKKGCGLWQFIKKLFAKDPDQAAHDAELLKQLLVLAEKDLELALRSIDGKEKSYQQVFPAIGNLNHALSALKKGNPPKHLKPAFKQLTKRISHAKFYLVAFDFDEASARIEAAKDYIGTLD